MFDRPKPTTGCSANGGRRRINRELKRNGRKRGNLKLCKKVAVQREVRKVKTLIEFKNDELKCSLPNIIPSR